MMETFEKIVVLLLTGSAFMFGCATLWYVAHITQSEATVRTFEWEGVTYLVATGTNGDVAMTAHFDPLP